jgi:hypothetical protein
MGRLAFEHDRCPERPSNGKLLYVPSDKWSCLAYSWFQGKMALSRIA